MSDLINRPFTDAINVPRPSRRPCAAVPMRQFATTTQQGVEKPVPQQPAVHRQPSPVSERSNSPITASESLSNLHTPSSPNTVGAGSMGASGSAMTTASGLLTVPQMYERMNVLMLEMNMLMAQWEVAMQQAGVDGGSKGQLPPSEAFKGMLNAFGSITAQYTHHQHKQQAQQNQQHTAAQASMVERKQSAPVITTVQQSGGGVQQHHHRWSNNSPDAQGEQAQQSQLSEPTSRGQHNGGYQGRNNAAAQGGHGGNAVSNFSNQNLDLDRDCIVAVVEFKRQRMKRFACAHFVEPGQYVIVDGDRGQDCGFVVYCSVRNPDGSLGLTQSIENARLDVSRIKAEPGIVRGLASEKDIALLHGEIATNERMALKICRDLVEQMELPMKVVDCEYQFDRRKISFYFESSRSIDFRTLTTELYRIFGVRIWLENQNNKVKNVVPDGAFSHNDKSTFQKNGLRPPTL